MKYVKTEPTPYLTLYSLEGREDKFSRMSMYNKIILKLDYQIDSMQVVKLVVNVDV